MLLKFEKLHVTDFEKGRLECPLELFYTGCVLFFFTMTVFDKLPLIAP